MANYFVIDNTFRPYSFDELIKPYQMYGEAYKQDDSLREMQATITPLTPTDLPPAVAVAQSNPPTDSSVAVVTPLYVDPGSIPDDAIVG